MAAPYRWKIDKDYFDPDSKYGKNSVGVQGPSDLDESITDNPQGFVLYDDDRNAYCHGMLYGDYQGDEPLMDYGMPAMGCTMLKFDGDTDMTVG